MGSAVGTVARLLGGGLVAGAAGLGVLVAVVEPLVSGGLGNVVLLGALTAVSWVALGRPWWGSAGFGLCVLALGAASWWLVAAVWLLGTMLVLGRGARPGRVARTRRPDPTLRHN